MFRFGLTLFIALNIFSSEKLNENVLNELSTMIMSDPATQALIVSHNGKIVLEQYGKGYSETDFVTSCLLYTSPSPRDKTPSRMPSSA